MFEACYLVFFYVCILWDIFLGFSSQILNVHKVRSEGVNVHSTGRSLSDGIGGSKTL